MKKILMVLMLVGILFAQHTVKNSVVQGTTDITTLGTITTGVWNAGAVTSSGAGTFTAGVSGTTGAFSGAVSGTTITGSGAIIGTEFDFTGAKLIVFGTADTLCAVVGADTLRLFPTR